MTPLISPGRPSEQRRSKRSLVAAGLVFVGLTAVGVPLTASAQIGDRPIGVDEPAADAAAPIEVLKLRCGVRQSDAVAGVHCRWSTPTAERAVGLRLWRVVVGSHEGRQVVFRTEDVTVNSYTDAPVRPGHRYVYVIQALNATGRTVGLSRGAYVAVPRPDVRPDVEVLRLECVPGDDFRVGCKWTLPTAPGARTLTLWRSVDGGARERVVSSHHPFPTAYRDTVPDGTSRVVYAVIATNGIGEIVARSRAAVVTFRDIRPTDVKPTDVVPTDVAPSDVKPTDVRPPDVRPPDVKPTDVRPSDRRAERGGSAG